MGLKGVLAGVLVVSLCIGGAMSWHAHRERTAERQALDRAMERSVQELAGQANAYVQAGLFYSADFILPKHILDSDPVNRYLPEKKRQAIRSVSGITLWPRPQDGSVFAYHMFKTDLFNFLPRFFRKPARILTERERRLQAFGQLQGEEAREVYDVQALSAWFKHELGVDVLARQFVLEEPLTLESAAYDVDREHYVLKDVASLVPARVASNRRYETGAVVSRKADGRIVIGEQYHSDYALVTTNLPAISAKLGTPALVPMKFEDARCNDKQAFYRFVPVAPETLEDKPLPPLPTKHGSVPLHRLETLEIPVRISEVHVYCNATKQLLWSQTF